MTAYYADFDLGDGLNDGSTWLDALRTESAFENWLEAVATAGDILYVQGAATLTADSAWDGSARDGTAVDPITIIGVINGTTNEEPTYADWADANLSGGADQRPTIALGANVWTIGDYCKLYNLIITGTAVAPIVLPVYDIMYNCKVTNISATANRVALYAGVRGKVISSEGISTNGYAIIMYAGSEAHFCYVHDSNIGLAMAANDCKCLFCVSDTCVYNASIAAYISPTYFGCVLYNASTQSMYATSSYGGIFINNIIDTTPDGFKWTTQTDINFFMNNHQGNSVTDMWDLVEETVVAHKDNAVTSGDPLFHNAAGGVFHLESGSPCLNTGLSAVLGT